MATEYILGISRIEGQKQRVHYIVTDFVDSLKHNPAMKWNVIKNL